MELSKARVKSQVVLLEKALKTLREAIRMKQIQIVRDGVVQRFEYVFELSWKSMKLAAEFKGTLCSSPRDSIRAAYKMGWVKDPELWFIALEARNSTSHTYNRKTAGSVYRVARKFPPLALELLAALKKI